MGTIGGLNSIMVRLKSFSTSEITTFLNSGLNSIMVRLKCRRPRERWWWGNNVSIPLWFDWNKVCKKELTTSIQSQFHYGSIEIADFFLKNLSLIYLFNIFFAMYFVFFYFDLFFLFLGGGRSSFLWLYLIIISFTDFFL